MTSEHHYPSDPRYLAPLARCLCCGQSPSIRKRIDAQAPRAPINDAPVHEVLVAFLLYKNEEYGQQTSLRDYMFLSVNWVTTLLTRRDFIHVQLVFWDELQKVYYTYSVNDKENVNVTTRKRFSKRSWKFLRLKVTETQELAMLNFLRAQLGKPLNRTGQFMALLTGASGGEEQWFCSEMVAEALDRAGLVNYRTWNGVSAAEQAAPHHIYDYLLHECVACQVSELRGNPLDLDDMMKKAAARGAAPLVSESGEIMAVYDHAYEVPQTSGAAPPAQAREEHEIDFMCVQAAPPRRH